MTIEMTAIEDDSGTKMMTNHTFLALCSLLDRVEMASTRLVEVFSCMKDDSKFTCSIKVPVCNTVALLSQ